MFKFPYHKPQPHHKIPQKSIEENKRTENTYVPNAWLRIFHLFSLAFIHSLTHSLVREKKNYGSHSLNSHVSTILVEQIELVGDNNDQAMTMILISRTTCD